VLDQTLVIPCSADWHEPRESPCGEKGYKWSVRLQIEVRYAFQPLTRIKKVLTLKFGRSWLGPGRSVRPGPLGGLTGVPYSQFGTRLPGGLTAPRGRSNRGTPSLSRIRSLAWFRVVNRYLQGKTSHPINIKSRGQLRPIIQSTLSILSYFLQTLTFLTSVTLLLRLHDGCGSSEWPADLRTTLSALFLTGSLP
jgi:hypothetical protein